MYRCQGAFYEYQYTLSLGFNSQDLKDAIAVECDWAACMKPGVNSTALSETCQKLLGLAS